MTGASSAEISGGTAGMAGYYRRLEQAGLAPLWESLSALAPREPAPRALPHVWRYGEAREHLLEAGRLISAEDAERRVVVLANPGLPGKLQVTDTLYAGLLQPLVIPGHPGRPAGNLSAVCARHLVSSRGA